MLQKTLCEGVGGDGGKKKRANDKKTARGHKGTQKMGEKNLRDQFSLTGELPRPMFISPKMFWESNTALT